MTHDKVPGIIRTNLSDHYIIILITRNCDNIYRPQKKTNLNKIKCRDFSKFSGSEFNTDLKVAVTEFMNSLPLITEINFNEIFNRFINVFQDGLNKHMSMKPLSHK